MQYNVTEDYTFSFRSKFITFEHVHQSNSLSFKRRLVSLNISVFHPIRFFRIGCLVTVVRSIETIAKLLYPVAEIESLLFLPRIDYDLLSFINYNNKKLSKGSILHLHPVFSLRSIPILNINHNTLQIKRSSDNQIVPSKHSRIYNRATQSQRCHFLFQWC